MRLSIELSPEQHQRLKAAAALQGQSIKDYVLERTLPDAQENKALRELETLLKPRAERAMRGDISDKTVDQIFDDVKRSYK
tara:strand:+ start:697 stop:939 length:243 start_codon:yes stop_codon:yes gene_type:complete